MTDLALQPETITESSETPTPAHPMGESLWERRIFAALAMLLVVGFFFLNRAYHVPAYHGTDQNGYLVGGRMLAENLTMRLSPTRPGSREFDPHQFVGRMWVGADLGTPQERYYPKYPIGYPALIAVSLWIGGDTWGPIIAYWINPLAMTLAVAGTFLLVRLVAGSFWAFCGTAVFATSPVVMGLTTNPNSHATAVCFAVWGMYLLIRWWQAGSVWQALAAGFLLGYTTTIRYTEGLLILPLLLVVAMNLRWRDKRSWLETFWALAGWAIPVAALVSYNLAAMGRITGYDGTNESIGFSWQFAADNWETMLRHLGTVALYCVFPFSVIGLVAMLWRSWRVGLVIAAWALPCIIVYIFYYWAPDPIVSAQTIYINYMRFVLTVMPGLVMAAYWLFDQVCKWIETAPAAPRWSAKLAQASFGTITLIAVAVHAHTSTFAAESDQISRLMLQANAERVLEAVPAGAVIFATDNGLLHHLQFARDYVLYTGETFSKAFVDRLPQMDPDEPQGWEPGRRDALYERLKGYTQQQLEEQQRQTMMAAIESGRRVFFIVPRRVNDPPLRRRSNELKGVFAGAEMLRRFATPDRFEVEVVSAWSTPVVRPAEPAKARARRPEVRIDRRGMSWQIVEVTKRPPQPPPPPKPAAVAPPPKPAKIPASRPARMTQSPRPATARAQSSTLPAATRPATRP